MLTKIEIDDCLQRLAGGAVAQRLGQHVQPGGIFGHDEDRDSGMPLLRSAGALDWARRARRWRRAVANLALAIASLALGAAQRALTLRLAGLALSVTEGQRSGLVFRHVTIIQGAQAIAEVSLRAVLNRSSSRPSACAFASAATLPAPARSQTRPSSLRGSRHGRGRWRMRFADAGWSQQQQGLAMRHPAASGELADLPRIERGLGG